MLNWDAASLSEVAALEAWDGLGLFSVPTEVSFYFTNGLFAVQNLLFMHFSCSVRPSIRRFLPIYLLSLPEQL